MHSGWHHPYHYYRHGGPSRIIWFIIGGLAASWWLKRREIHDYAHIGYCVRKPIQAPSPNQAQEHLNPLPEERTHLGVSQAPSGKAWTFGQVPPFGWEEEKERMLALGRQAGDTVRVSKYSKLCYGLIYI
jgi:hypothetical protein